MKKLLLFLLVTLSLIAGDFEKGMDAYYKGDYKTAISLWKPLAEQGEAEAQFYLGTMYDAGKGVLKDEKKAAYWAKKAHDNGEDVSKLWNEFGLWRYQ